MIVVSNTSPLNYLVLIQAVDVLPQLFGDVVLPSTVAAELLDPAAPARVREWIASPPESRERRQDRIHRRFLSALKALAQVRRLLSPAVQVNIAREQVNVSG